MASVKGPDGKETHLRAIIFREGDVYVAQCLEYDIATQAPDIDSVIDRLELTIEAEFAHCGHNGTEPHKAITPAPNYYHDLWESRTVALTRANISIPEGAPQIDYALAKAA
jgi:hypothetical protein